MALEGVLEALDALAELTPSPPVDAHPGELLAFIEPILRQRQRLLSRLEAMIGPAGVDPDHPEIRSRLRRVEAADRDWQRTLSSARDGLSHRVGALRRLRQTARQNAR